MSSSPETDDKILEHVEQKQEQGPGGQKHIAGWAVVNRQGDVDTGDESSSTSSMEFVVLDDDASVSFGRRQRSLSPSSLDIPSTPSTSSSTQSSPAQRTLSPWENGWYWDDLDTVQNLTDEEDASGQLDESSSEQGASSPPGEEDLRSDASVEVLSCSPADDPHLPPTALGLQPRLAPSEEGTSRTEEVDSDREMHMEALSDLSSSSLEVIHHPESASSQEDDGDQEPRAELPGLVHGEPEENQKMECNDLGELGKAEGSVHYEEENEDDVESIIDGYESEEEDSEEKVDVGLQEYVAEEGAVGGLPLAAFMGNHDAVHMVLNLQRQHSDSDSESDFQRLDAQVGEDDRLLPESVQDLRASSRSGSSVGSNFRFVHHPHGNHPGYHFDDDDDSIPGDVDDRCESDISGIAADESDLSSMTYSIGDVPLTAGVKSYMHRPNSNLNATLTFFAIVALLLGIGIGIGHYLGTTEDDLLHEMQIAQMKNLQDDYLMCLRRTDLLQNELDAMASEEDKWAAVTSTWKLKYEELALQKVELEHQLLEFEKFRSSGLSQVQELATDAQKLEVENSQLQQSLSWQAQRAADLETKLAVLTEETRALTSTRTRLEDRHVHLQKRVDELTLEKESWEITQGEDRKRLEEVEKELAAATSTLMESHSQLTTCQTGLSHANNEQQELRAQLNQVRLENEDLKSAVVRGRYSRHPANMAPSDLLKQATAERGPRQPKAMDSQPLTESQAVQQPVESHAVHTEGESVYAKKEDPLEPTSPGRLPSTPDDGEHLPDVHTPGQANPSRSRATGGATEQSSQDPIVADLCEKLRRLNKELEWEQTRSDLWQSLFTKERSERMKWESSSPNVFSCMQILVPKVDLSAFSRIVTDLLSTNASDIFQRNMAFFQNITADTEFYRNLSEKWDQFQKYTKKSDMKSCLGKAEKKYREIEKVMATKWQEFQDFTQSKIVQDSMESTKSGFVHLVDKVVNMTSPSKLHDVVNRTKETMSRLNDQLQDTWQRVKNLSNDILKKPKHTMDKVQGKLSEKLGNIASTVHSNWEKVRNKFHKDGWFKQHGPHWNHHHRKSHQGHGKKSHEGHKKRGHQHEKHTDNSGHQQGHDLNHQYYTHSQYGPSIRRPYNSGYDKYGSGNFPNSFTDEHGKGPFEDRPHHKQRQSNHENKKYEEFWKQAEYDPNDFMYEGFFEGNNREWRKHQKTLKKLHGRINRLNEDVLHAMDDDDIEDIYEDLEDFQDDIEDDVQPEKLKTWLTCQLRWWKGRFQRKHRSEDWLYGCGRQLMHWQLRALCKPKCKGKHCKDRLSYCRQIMWTVPRDPCHGPRCRAHHTNQGFQHKMVQEAASRFQSHIRNPSHQSDHSPTRKKTANVDVKREFKPMSPIPPAEETVNATFWELVNGDQADWYFRRVQDREDHLVSSEWYFRRAEHREDLHHDPLWYVRAMTKHAQKPGSDEDQPNEDAAWVLEYHEQEPNWMIQRAEKRDFERSKPWYLHRAEDREFQHHKLHE